MKAATGLLISLIVSGVSQFALASHYEGVPYFRYRQSIKLTDKYDEKFELATCQSVMSAEMKKLTDAGILILMVHPCTQGKADQYFETLGSFSFTVVK